MPKRKTESEIPKVKLGKSLKTVWLRFLETPAPWEINIEGVRQATKAAKRPNRTKTRHRVDKRGRPVGYIRGKPDGGVQFKRWGARMNALQARRRKARMIEARRRRETDRPREYQPWLCLRDPETGRMPKTVYPWPGGHNAAAVLAFEPGEWCAWPDVRQRAGLPKGAGTLRRLERSGLIERAQNAEWKTGQPIWGPPRYLWRLTAAGLKFKAGVLVCG